MKSPSVPSVLFVQCYMKMIKYQKAQARANKSAGGLYALKP